MLPLVQHFEPFLCGFHFQLIFQHFLVLSGLPLRLDNLRGFNLFFLILSLHVLHPLVVAFPFLLQHEVFGSLVFLFLEFHLEVTSVDGSLLRRQMLNPESFLFDLTLFLLFFLLLDSDLVALSGFKKFLGFQSDLVRDFLSALGFESQAFDSVFEHFGLFDLILEGDARHENVVAVGHGRGIQGMGRAGRLRWHTT